MFADHPVFERPADPNATIWRYLDFTKFVDLLDTSSLFFTRADRFHDRFEGSYPQFNMNIRPQVYGDIPESALQMAAETSRLCRRWMAINCWHLNPHESAAMWRLYIKSNEGIAIRSTYANLASSLLPCDDTIYSGVVKYIDYQTEWMPEGNMFYPFLHKRRSFAHENELRCIICRYPKSGGEEAKNEVTISDGIRVQVNLARLISGIFVAPESQPWMTRLIESLARKYSINVTISRSGLDGDPVY